MLKSMPMLRYTRSDAACAAFYVQCCNRSERMQQIDTIMWLTAYINCDCVTAAKVDVEIPGYDK